MSNAVDGDNPAAANGSVDAGRTASLFVYDADCGFCTRTAGWLDRHVDGAVTFAPWQSTDLDALGLTVEDVTSAAWCVAPDGRTQRGVDAIAAALRAGRGPWPLAGRALGAPPLRWLGAPIYSWIARNRHAMPGGTAACRIGDGPGRPLNEEPPLPARPSHAIRGRVVTYVSLLVIVVVALAGQEAWPLTSFALFSKVRTGQQATVQVVAVDRQGGEIPVDLGRNHAATRGATHLIPHLRAKSPEDQRAEVTSWIVEAGLDPTQLVAARVYRTVREVSRDGHRGRIVSRRLTLQIPLPDS